ncbi:putative ATP-dependent RNA helicase TDRD12 isoform X1 [Lepisosteus oculatus]|uniref:putative ATP-dependent RNA helicase TDRD12 isoform X1 n=1 Tax=Lepisosteus oculatus TaxID=7918 RepID=UPI0035F5088C
MMEISILMIEDPGCFWGKILKGDGVNIESPKVHEKLQDEMNLFYHNVKLDVQQLKAPSLEQEQVCVVYSPSLKSWCRAFVECLFLSSEGQRVQCFLVDHAKHIIVSADEVRIPLEKFFQLPFLAQKFSLAHIHPLALRVDLLREETKFVPKNFWDVSSVIYFNKLVQASTLAQAVLCGVEGNCLEVELYLTIEKMKVCVNDVLVTEKFACYSSSIEQFQASPEGSSADRTPATSLLQAKSSDEASPKEVQVVKSNVTLHFKEPKTNDHSLGTQIGSMTGVMKEARGDVAMVTQRGAAVCDLGAAEAAEELQDKNLRNVETSSLLAQASVGELDCSSLLKFLNPEENAGSKRVVQEAAQDVSREGAGDRTGHAHNPDVISAAPERGKNSGTDECDERTEEDSPEAELHCFQSSVALSAEVRQGSADTRQQDLDELACARLLQFLNPDPLNSGSESEDPVSLHCDPSESGVLVHSPLPISPCRSLAKALLTPGLREALARRKYPGPDVAAMYCWPAVAQGGDTLLVSRGWKDPLVYIPPLLTFMQLCTVHMAPTTSNGPIAVVLCPGWERAQLVFDTLEECSVRQPWNPMLILVGLQKEEAKAVRIKKACLIVVTTPFGLLRLMEFHCFKFLRLCHLVLDEVDVLFSRAPEEMSAVLQHFKKILAYKEWGVVPHQLIAVGGQWSRQMESLVREHMSNPSIILTAREEAALYGNVQQVILLCLDCYKLSVMLSTLDFVPDVPQKILIFADSVEEVEHVYKAVCRTSAFCMKAHQGLTYEFNFVIEQWRKDISPGTSVALVLTNECINALGITDATCVVHYGFPRCSKLFGSRLHCMSDHFQNLAEMDAVEQQAQKTKSVLLLSERNTGHVVGVLRYFERAGAVVPPELIHFAEGVLKAREDQKSRRPLCSSLKCFGFCRNERTCPDRHTFNPDLDALQIPDSGCITILPLHVESASCFFGRIVRKKDDCYERLAAEMAEYYVNHKRSAVNVEKGGLYGVQEETVLHRVQVLSLPEKVGCLFYRVCVRFIDEGRTEEVKAHQLLVLPSQFHSLPPQAVEFILCRVKPIDSETEWHPKVTRRISQKIKRVQHEAKVALCLEKTVWVDPVVHVTWLPALKMHVNDYSLRSEILATGMGVDNPEHLERLKRMCQDRGLSGQEQPGQPMQLQSAPQVLEEGVAEGSPDIPEPCSQEGLEGPGEGVHLQRGNSVRALQDLRVEDGLPQTGHVLQDVAPNKRLHPEIKWFQREDSVTLKFKLLNPRAQQYTFHHDKVTYSACVDEKYYYADLELYGNVVEDKCSVDIKCNEPVMTLLKESKGEWPKLLKHKNAFVSLDFEHFVDSEDEDNLVSGCSTETKYFSAVPLEEGSYVYSDSESD